MADTAVEAQARVIYERFQADILASTALAQIPRWIESGSPPPADDLRAAGFSGDEVANLDDIRLARKAFVRTWGFAIPCAEAVISLRKLGPLVELGAGSGYWSAMMRAAGHDIIATDLHTGKTRYGAVTGSVTPILQLSGADAVLAHPERGVFCSWPGAGESWLAEALALLKPERPIALILDERPDITGDESLRDFLTRSCELIGKVQIPRFPNVRDQLLIYRKLTGG